MSDEGQTGIQHSKYMDLVACPINITHPRWDQRTFVGRLNHFARITNPLLLFKSRKELESARELFQLAKNGYMPRGTTVRQLYAAKVLCDSAIHPDSGEIMTPIGRMSAQVPCGMVITGILLAYYKTLPEVFVAQWINQTFNALVNHTNRNAKSRITNMQILQSYVSATGGAVTASVLMNHLVKGARPVVRRWVPFVAVATANCINIPMMRQRELIDGVTVVDEAGQTHGESKLAALKGISQVCFSRIAMAAPGMLLVPVLMERLERYKFFRRGRVFSAGIQTMFIGMGLVFMVPIGCALFPQYSSIKTVHLEKSLQKRIQQETHPHTPQRVYFNKGL